MDDRRHSVLVVGATGTQGSAAVRGLSSRGHRVRALTREPARARHLAELGAEVVVGDLGDPAAVEAVLDGATAVFAVPVRDPGDDTAELRNATFLIEAAKRSGVRHFVQTSVAGTGDLPRMPRWGSGHWNEEYWETKRRIEEAVRDGGLPAYTILKPSFLMENLLPPKAPLMFPELARGEIVTAVGRHVRVQMISADDIAAFAVAALERPGRFSGQSIELAAEALTMHEVAAIIGAVTQRTVRAVSLAPSQAVAAGRPPAVVRGEEWLNEVGYQAPIDALASYGVALTGFRRWAETHRSRLLGQAGG
ncbi:NmrA/HSCARG family protein [Microbispora sp. NBRC 16548]|uniref:NmrA/HSCARG family protein n=1 Tax=Microbispora sp. NBRC 16548 TaxID=3030994 RepID=UPI00161B33FA|nr:NmrA/HSCARG family protein [Microbispora sp. NBRC 16548]GLX04542.1 NmrA family transcriptional regulator [Microbispora sp. NBRC 16548]